MVGQANSSTANASAFSEFFLGRRVHANRTTPSSSRHSTRFAESWLDSTTPNSARTAATPPSESSDASPLPLEHFMQPLSPPTTTQLQPQLLPPSQPPQPSYPSSFNWDNSLNFHSRHNTLPLPLSPNEEELQAFEKRTGYLICTPDETTKMALFSLGF